MLITFDLDGVLMLNPFGSGVFPHVRKAISEHARVEEGEVRKAILQEARARQQEGLMVESYDWDDIIRQVAKRFGLEWTESIASLVEFYCQEPHIRLYPGAFELLSELNQKGYQLFSLTNGYHKYQYPVLRALGIVQFFERILTPEQAGYAKPSPEFYRWALEGTAPPHVHIGDTVIHDVWGANRSGATSIWIQQTLPDGWKEKTPRERAEDPLIHDLVAKAIADDMCPNCYPDLKVADAIPHFLIGHLREVPLILEQLTKA